MYKMNTPEDMYFASLVYSQFMKREGSNVLSYALRSVHILKDMPQYCYIGISKVRYIVNYIELIRSSQGFKYRLIGSDERDVIDSFKTNPDAFWSYYPICPMYVTIAKIPYMGGDTKCFFLNNHGDTSITENHELILNLDNQIEQFKNTIYTINPLMFTSNQRSAEDPLYVYTDMEFLCRCKKVFTQRVIPIYSKDRNPKEKIYTGYKIKDRFKDKPSYNIYMNPADFMKAIPCIQSESEIGKMIKTEDGSYTIVTMEERNVD